MSRWCTTWLGVAVLTACGDTSAPRITDVQVLPAELTLRALGDTVRFYATATDSDGDAAPGASFSWVSSNTDVATVDDRGLVTAVGSGSARITATADGTSDFAMAIVPGQTIFFTYVVQPSYVAVGEPIAPSVQIAATDRQGNPVADAGIDLAPADPGGLSGTPSARTNAAGVATFPELRVTPRGLHRLRAKLSGANELETPSQPFSVVEIDQQQTAFDFNTAGTLTVGGASNQRLAQVVTIGLGGALSDVRLLVACRTGDLVVDVFDANGAAPGQSLLGSQTLPAASLPPFSGAPTFRTLIFTTPIPVTTGQSVAIALRNAEGTAGDCDVVQSPVGDHYARGNGFYDARPNPPGWLTLGARADLPFKVAVR